MLAFAGLKQLWETASITPRQGCNRIADLPAKCSNLARPRDRDALRMVQDRTTNFRKLAVQFILGGIARRMIKANLPQRRPRPPTISHYAMAVLSVAVAIIGAELITRLLHT